MINRFVPVSNNPTASMIKREATATKPPTNIYRFYHKNVEREVLNNAQTSE